MRCELKKRNKNKNINRNINKKLISNEFAVASESGTSVKFLLKCAKLERGVRLCKVGF